MIKVLFVCLGNICRSPMAEYVFKDIVKKNGREKDFYIESAGTSGEEAGNDMHHGTKNILKLKGIPFERHQARKITPEDYKNFDLIIGMELSNMYRMQLMWDKDPDDKIKLLLTYAGKDRDIADPWYTGNFEKTYNDVVEGCNALFEKVK